MIELNKLTKSYNQFNAVDQLSLKIEKGTVFGFVGANGAGKTTTFNMLATLLSPTSGEIIIDGIDIAKEPQKIRQRIGYMPDFFGVYDQLKADEYLSFFGSSYGMTNEAIKKQIPRVLQLVQLNDKRYEYVENLSRGMQQRLCLARTLMHDPEVLILDEPASGLDPRARVEMREVLIALKKMGKTIVISSHILPELAEICDELGVIDEGKLIASGNIEAIQKHLTVEKTITVKLWNEFDSQLAKQFFEDEQIKVTSVNLGELTLSFMGSEEEQFNLLKKAMLANIPIISFTENKKNLEDVFMAITEGEKLDERIQ